MNWVSPWDVPPERTMADVDREVLGHLRGIWGLFLDGLQRELRELRRDCLAAEPGPEADFAYDCYRAQIGAMEWAAKQVDRMYLEDRRKVAIDWSWDREPHPPEPADAYAGDHTLEVD